MEHKIIDLSKIIGVCTLCSTGTVLVYQIDYGEDKVLAGVNGEAPEWCSMAEQSLDDELEPGFMLGSFFIPFSQVMRFYTDT